MQSERNNDIAAFRIAHAARPVVLFDLDGTLVETDAANTAAYRAALAARGQVLHVPAGVRVTGGMVRAALPSLTAEDLRVLSSAKAAAYARGLDLTRLGPACGDLRRVLRNRDRFARVVLLTESNARRAWETLRHHGLAGCFDEVVCNGGHGDKYANYFATHAVDPADCFAWENESGKVQSAQEAGIDIEHIRKVA